MNTLNSHNIERGPVRSDLFLQAACVNAAWQPSDGANLIAVDNRASGKLVGHVSSMLTLLLVTFGLSRKASDSAT